ncbi:Hypothetical protein CAP_2159 [Chondromyces apiculatus DSM 436]|uniref:Uncharacterized protein n=1 Tax=Chondromyces apiculatus DSM 436 TaxID=1192034 RepID=A0A017TCC8_9BACT|nr:Hypothetical protein CAP_2159 [Chondromyces apiculatus DSM 436]
MRKLGGGTRVEQPSHRSRTDIRHARKVRQHPGKCRSAVVSEGDLAPLRVLDDPVRWVAGPRPMGRGTPSDGSQDPVRWVEGPCSMGRVTLLDGSQDPVRWVAGPCPMGRGTPSDGTSDPARWVAGPRPMGRGTLLDGSKDPA